LESSGFPKETESLYSRGPVEACSNFQLPTSSPPVQLTLILLPLIQALYVSCYLSVPFSQAVKTSLLKQFFGDKRVDICSLQEICSGTISIPGFETVVEPFSSLHAGPTLLILSGFPWTRSISHSLASLGSKPTSSSYPSPQAQLW